MDLYLDFGFTEVANELLELGAWNYVQNQTINKTKNRLQIIFTW
jgi:hypothetical protein